MKKFIAIASAAVILLSLAACSDGNGTAETTTSGDGKLIVDGTTYGTVEETEAETKPANARTFAEFNGQLRVKDDKINIRTDTVVSETTVKGQAKKGDILTATGKSDDGWYRITFENTTCYVKASVVIEVPVETVLETPQIKYCTAASLNVRSSTDVDDASNIVGGFVKGDEVTVLAEIKDSTWVRVKYTVKVGDTFTEYTDGYLNGKYLSTEKPAETTTAAQ